MAATRPIDPDQIQETPSGAKLVLGAPVVVSLSEPGLTKWGPHQFASLSPYPGGVLCRFSGGEDSIRAYGVPNPTFLSQDGGLTWTPHTAPGLPDSGIVGEMYDGEYLCLKMTDALDTEAEQIPMPEPLNPGEPFLFYRVEDCPPVVQEYFSEIEGARWTPETGEWRPVRVTYDMENLLVWSRSRKRYAGLLSTTWFENPPVRAGGAILAPDYRRNYMPPSGVVPKHLSTSCMASEDNGRTFRQRAFVAVTEEEGDIMAEPDFAVTRDGDVLCMIRRGGKRPMALSRSTDAGRTWSPLQPVLEYGVKPSILGLEAGPVVLAYGRPGVKVTFDPTGAGTDWAEPVTLLEGDPEDITVGTDGYTGIVHLGANRFLLSYTNFDWPHPDGGTCKAVLVRQGEVKA